MNLRRTSAALVFIATAATLTVTAVAQSASGAAPAETPSSTPAGSFVAGQVLTHFRSGVSPAEQAAVVRGVGATNAGTIRDLDVDVLRVPAGAEQRVIDALLRSGKVTSAERNARLLPTDTIPNDPYYKTGTGAIYGGQWELPQIKAPTAWDISTGSPSVVVAVVDSGVAPHPDLARHLSTGHNVLDGSTNTNDTYGHGTYVAGTIAAESNNSQGIAGACWNCEILPVKVYTSSSALTSDVATGISWAADHGAKVINVSMGTTSQSSTLDSAVSYATNHGALVVASSGNSGCNCITYPAGSPGALGVAASDQTDTLYSYSNYGSWVGIDAPSGETTTSLTDPATGAQWGYMPVGGTSLAAPVVSAVAGLVLSVAPGLSATSLKSVLMQSADPVAGTHTVASGRVNAYRAMLAAGASSPTPSPSLSPSPTTSTTSPTASPTASPTPSPTTTTIFSGTLSSKSPSKAFLLTMGSGAAQGVLSFSKCTSMTVGLATSGGASITSASGGSGVAVSTTVSAGSYTWTASGSGRCTFTLTVTYTS
jgi:thermitase